MFSTWNEKQGENYMGKIKIKSRTIIKKHDGEVYHFKNGFAKVPGCIFSGKPMKISLKEFQQLKEAI